MEIKREMLSEYQLKIDDLYNISIGNVKKLVPNFFDKEKYVLHYANLQLNLRLGLKPKKIHRVLDFNQSHWLKPYIEFNTQKRIETEKPHVEFITQNRIEAEKMSHKLFDNNLVAIRKSNISLKLNKPVYTGMYILELI